MSEKNGKAPGNEVNPQEDPEELLNQLLRVVRADVVTLSRKKKLGGFDRKAISDYVGALVKAAAHRRKADEDDKDLNDATADELDRMAEDLRARAQAKRVGAS